MLTRYIFNPFFSHHSFFMKTTYLRPNPDGPFVPRFEWQKKDWQIAFDPGMLQLVLPCRIRMLMVTDGSGSFDGAGFGLENFLKAFQEPAPYVRFQITKAHRRNPGSGEDLQNFRFNTHDLTQYDVIWLFGVERQQGLALSDQELKAIAQYMNAGGGVFATGDHEDLGVDMCGEVPRVRSMRRWYFNTAGPFGEPSAPPAFGSNHSTLTDDPTTGAIENDQSDKVPQVIYPSYRFGRTFSHWYRYPHPVLCGPDGIIKHLPDHMHEGLCELPYETGRSMTFDGYTIQEYPNGTSGAQVLPEVIARAKNFLNNDYFGVISAYDGHRTENEGRVLCDATWHHFFNINLIGFEDAVQRVNDGVALPGDETAVQKYSEIQQYYRNIAYWLTRRNDQKCMRNKGIHLSLANYDLAMNLHKKASSRDWSYYLFIGKLAKDALNHYASQCQIRAWFLELVPLELRPVFHDFMPTIEKVKPELELLDVDMLENILIGAAWHEMYQAISSIEKFSDKQMEQVLEQGSKMMAETFKNYAEYHKQSCETLSEIAYNLK